VAHHNSYVIYLNTYYFERQIAVAQQKSEKKISMYQNRGQFFIRRLFGIYFPILVCCTKKNLVTLRRIPGSAVSLTRATFLKKIFSYITLRQGLRKAMAKLVARVFMVLHTRVLRRTSLQPLRPPLRGLARLVRALRIQVLSTPQIC
jgi:hypothetical protein